MIENEYKDLGAVTREAQEIYNKSRSYIAGVVGNEHPEDRIRQRCVIATGDVNVAEIMQFKNDPLNAGLKALEKGAGIYADIKMVEAGVVKKGHQSKVTIFLGKGDDIAEERGVTRASAGVMKLKDELDGSIVLIGNAPSALLTLCDLIEDDVAKPELVIGVPVGFVNAAESKERLRQMDVPSISVVGTRGGTPIAVASMNEIINMYQEIK